VAAITIYEIVMTALSAVLIILMLYNVILKIRNNSFWYLSPKIEITSNIISLSAAGLALASFIGALIFKEKNYTLYGFIWLANSWIWQVNK
jgi:hypothetical protein